MSNELTIVQPNDIATIQASELTTTPNPVVDSIRDEYRVLEGNDHLKSQGSWVRNDQGVHQEFSAVSKTWIENGTITIEEGLERIDDEARHRRDILIDAKSAKILTDEHGLFLEIDGANYRPNDWSGKQLCSKLATPQTLFTQYSKPFDSHVLAYALSHGQKGIDKQLLFRCYDDGTLRGVLSDSYSIVENRWYLELLAELIPGARLSHFEFSSADTIIGNVLIPDSCRVESDSDYGGMLAISNSEIGERIISQTPSIFRAICQNGCIWGERAGIEIRRRHRGIDLAELRQQLTLNIQAQIPLVSSGIDRLLASHSSKLTAGVVQAIAFLATQHNLGSNVAEEIASQWLKQSKEKSAFGLTDAITRAGQLFGRDVWRQCDEIGGQVVNMAYNGKSWEAFDSRAKLLTNEEVNKVFGVKTAK